MKEKKNIDHNTQECRPNPYLGSSFLSKLFFCWINPLLIKAFKRGLNDTDIYSIPKEYSSKTSCSNLERYWQNELKSSKNVKDLSIVKTFIKCYKKEIFIMFISFFILNYITLIPPIFIGKLLDYFKENPTLSTKDAWLYALGISLTSLTSWIPSVSVAFAHGKLTTIVRSAFTSLIFKKTLRLSSKGQSMTSTGQIITLLSTDIEKFYWVFIYFSFVLFGLPIFFIVGYFLYVEFQAYSFIGMGLFVISLPIQTFVSRMFGKLRVTIANRTDDRLNITEQLLTGIRVVKMYCWEIPFSKYLNYLRQREIFTIRKGTYYRGLNWLLYLSNGKLVVLLIVLPYTLGGNTLLPKQIFMAIAWVEILRPIAFQLMPVGIESLTETHESLKRIQTFLLLDEKLITTICSDEILGENGKVFIEMKDLSCNWPKPNENVDAFKLRNLNFYLDDQSNKLTTVVGQVGSGKSSFLYALLNEMQIESGTKIVNGKISYASQEPWLFSGTIRDNIIYGEEFNEKRYETIIGICSLESDLKQMPFYDMTNVGERGLSLSGGQKARVNLARAVYRKAHLYLLDDPLSAVDNNVCKNIFNRCIKGFLKDKHVILITHQMHVLKYVDRILVMNDGRLELDGNYGQFLNKFQRLMASENIDYGDRESLDNLSLTSITTRQRARTSSFGNYGKRNRLESTSSVQKPSMMNIADGNVIGIDDETTIEIGVDMETRRVTGMDTWRAFGVYLNAAKGKIFGPILIILTLIIQSSFILIDILLSQWAQDMEDISVNSNHTSFLSRDNYARLYGGLVGLLFVGGTIRTLLFFTMTAIASLTLHRKMLNSLLYCTVQFFNINPAGRILNRFARDLGFIDDILALVLLDVFHFAFHFGAILIYTIVSNPWMGLLIVPVLIIVSIIRYFVIPLIRELKKHEAMNRNPIYSIFDTMMKGLYTIRAFDKENTHIEELFKQQDKHSACWFLYVMADRWFTNKLEILIGIYISGLIFMSVGTADILDRTSFGLSIIYSLSMLGTFQFVVRRSVEFESILNSVDRVQQYILIEREGDLISKNPPSAIWPNEGRIQFENVFLSYKQNGDYQLKNVNFEIEPSQKIGIVGRSGAGKSTIMSAILRLVEPEGKIKIDGINISKIGLHELRKVISIIPQDPILFSASLRENLDPFIEYSDEEIWKVLEEVQLKKKILKETAQLNSIVESSGLNYSVGERQLLCLGRAMLRQNRILIIDEATANVDSNTDNIIQAIIRTRFDECTVLTIAHRLDTIIDSDKVMVIDCGKVVEFDHAHKLIEYNGKFAQLLKQCDEKKIDRLTNDAYFAFLGKPVSNNDIGLEKIME